ncbi:hypothetical protein [Candidatus Minimicrobia naudis]
MEEEKIMAEKIYTVTWDELCVLCQCCGKRHLIKIMILTLQLILQLKKLNVEYDEKKYDFDKIREIVESAGYGLVEDMTEDKKMELYQEKITSLKKRLIWQLFLLFHFCIFRWGICLGRPFLYF